MGGGGGSGHLPRPVGVSRGKWGREEREIRGRGRKKGERERRERQGTVVYRQVSALQTSCSNDMLTSLQLSQQKEQVDHRQSHDQIRSRSLTRLCRPLYLEVQNLKCPHLPLIQPCHLKCRLAGAVPALNLAIWDGPFVWLVALLVGAFLLKLWKWTCSK